MKGTVHYEERGNVALLSIDNPPVNPLSSGVRAGLCDGVEKALADDSIHAVVITGMHRAFIAGADISEFGAAASAGPDLNQVLRDMEACLRSSQPGAQAGRTPKKQKKQKKQKNKTKNNQKNKA